jgi:hypothetical protein
LNINVLPATEVYAVVHSVTMADPDLDVAGMLSNSWVMLRYPPEDPEVPEEPLVPEVPLDPTPEVPEEPLDPEVPEVPLVPEDPEAPVGPVGPEEPDDPEAPVGPVGPEEPDDPEDPVAPGAPCKLQVEGARGPGVFEVTEVTRTLKPPPPEL